MYSDIDNNFAFYLGLIGLCISVIANIFQIYHNVKYKTVEGVSAMYIGAGITLSVIFLIYSAILNLIILVILNSVYLCTALVMSYYYKYGKKKTTQDKTTQSKKKTTQDKTTQSNCQDDMQIIIR